jgi:DNA-directed RNA polymerase
MTAFINAIKALIGSGKVTLEDLIKKISLQPKKVVPSTTVQAAIENLLSVYNYKSRAPIGLSDILTKARLDRTVSNQLTIEEKRKGALTASAGSFGS